MKAAALGEKKKTKRQNNAIPFTPTRPHQEKKRRGLTEYKENQELSSLFFFFQIGEEKENTTVIPV